MTTIPAATLDHLDRLAKAYADAREQLTLRANACNAEMRALFERCARGVKRSAADCAGLQAALVAAIQNHPELFDSPRTRTLHGIKIGYQKGKGRIEWESDEKVLAAIAKNYPAEVAETLILTKRTPAAAALAQLPAADLRRLGVTVTDAGDFVIVKAADGEIDKLVAKILKEGAIEEAAA
jgi:hypothetical protein